MSISLSYTERSQFKSLIYHQVLNISDTDRVERIRDIIKNHPGEYSSMPREEIFDKFFSNIVNLRGSLKVPLLEVLLTGIDLRRSEVLKSTLIVDMLKRYREYYRYGGISSSTDIILEMVRMLVRHGCDLNDTSRGSFTAVEYIISQHSIFDHYGKILSEFCRLGGRWRADDVLVTLFRGMSSNAIVECMQILIPYGFQLAINEANYRFINKICSTVGNKYARWFYNTISDWGFDLSLLHSAIALAYHDGLFDIDFLKQMIDSGVPPCDTTGSIRNGITLDDMTPNKIEGLRIIFDAISVGRPVYGDFGSDSEDSDY